MDLLLNSTTNPISKSTYDSKISVRKYKVYQLHKLVMFILFLCCSYSVLIVNIQTTELHWCYILVHQCLVQVFNYGAMILMLCLCYAIPIIKIRHKKETIKVFYVLVFIVLSCLVFKAQCLVLPLCCSYTQSFRLSFIQVINCQFITIRYLLS